MPKANRGYQLKYGLPKGYKDRQWFLFWYVRGTRRERASGIKNSRELDQAEAWRADFVAERNRPSGPLPPERMMVALALDIYGREHGPHSADPGRIGYAIQALLPFWGKKTAGEIKTETCRSYARQRTRTVKRDGKPVTLPIAPATTRRELGVLNAALHHCRSEGYLTVAPPVWLPEPTPARDRWMTRIEAAALLRAAKGEPKARLHLPTFILIGLYTGARAEAILGLQWQPNTEGGHVDLERGRIDFNPIGRKRTKKRRTRIPIPAQLALHLRQVRERTVRYVVEADGVRLKSVRRSYETACTGADLFGVVRHTLRHTACTWFMHRGVATWDAAGWVGMSEETFRQRYAHHHPDFMQAALASFKKSPSSSPSSRVDLNANERVENAGK